STISRRLATTRRNGPPLGLDRAGGHAITTSLPPAPKACSETSCRAGDGGCGQPAWKACGPFFSRHHEPIAMSDATTTVAALKDAVRRFADERAWEPFHSPKNLAMGLAVEAAELMEHFLWVDSAASREVANDPARRAEVADELADVACHLF